jgi:hypothetical protein
VAAPIKLIVDKLISNGFAKRNHLNKVVATGRRALVNDEFYSIISYYNSVIRGILNYYTFAANYSHLRKIVWLLHQSAALTLALKFKLKTMKKAFSKFGRFLKDPETDVKLYNEVSMKVKHQYNNSSSDIANSVGFSHIEKLLSQARSHSLTQIGLYKCAICESSYDIQMHHLRKAQDVRHKIRTGNSTYAQWVGGYAIKQVPLCKYHHESLHKGELNHSDFMKLSKWNG